MNKVFFRNQPRPRPKEAESQRSPILEALTHPLTQNADIREVTRGDGRVS